MSKKLRQEKRSCPYCRNTKTKIVRVVSLAPFNIWDDIVCLNCGERWEKNSKIDKTLRKGGI